MEMSVQSQEAQRQVMSPNSVEPQVEGVRYLTMRVFEAPGLMVRQAVDVMMDNQVAEVLGSLMQPERDEDLERTIDSVGTEMVRRTGILGKLLHQMVEYTKDINKRVTEDIQQWAEQVGIRMMQNFQEMDQRLPKGEVMQTILGQSGAVQSMVSKVEELVNNITQVETEQEQHRAGVEEDIRRKVGDGLSKMQKGPRQ